MLQKTQKLQKATRPKAKTKQLTSLFDERPKDRSRYDRYQEMQSWRAIPLPQATQNNLVRAMLEWCDKPDSRSIEQFLDERCIHESTFYKWCEDYPEIAETAKYVKTHIGIVRENGMADRKYDPRAYEATQRFYSTSWRMAADEDFERRKAIADKQPEHTTLVVFDALAEDLKKPPRIITNAEEVFKNTHQISTQANDSVAVTESTDTTNKRLTGGE